MDEILIMDGTELTLDGYTGFLMEVKYIILNELNTGKILKVKMFTENETKNLLINLNNLKVNDKNDFIMKIEKDILTVQKIITYKTGI